MMAIRLSEALLIGSLRYGDVHQCMSSRIRRRAGHLDYDVQAVWLNVGPISGTHQARSRTSTNLRGTLPFLRQLVEQDAFFCVPSLSGTTGD